MPSSRSVRLSIAVLLAVAPAALLQATLASAAGPSLIDGVWNRDDGNARVRIAPCGQNICATNVWIRDPSGGEAVGDRLVMTLKPAGASEMTGTAHDVKRDLNMSLTVTRSGNSFTSKGCVVGGIVCKSVGWTAAH